MAGWKKIIVSGSNAVLNQLNVDTNQQITPLASTTFLSGSFSGSFSGFFNGSTNLPDLTQGTGIVPFIYDGATTATVAVSGAAQLNNNVVIKWDSGSGKFVDSSTFDNGTYVYGSTSLRYTGAETQLTGSFTGSFKGDGSQLTGLVTTLDITGSNGTSGSVDLLTQGLTITGTSNEIETSVSGQTVTIGLPNDIVVSNDLTVLGDLTVAGTASFNNQTSLLIADRFALLASGSSTLTDGGIIVSAGLGYSGSAWYLESNAKGDYGRWAVAPNVDAAASSATADEYAVTAKLSATSAPADGTPPTWGGATNGKGNIWIKEDTGDIYIWA
jgi:hypothetical protein